MARRPADRGTRHPLHQGPGRARPVLRPVPAPARAGLPGAGGGADPGRAGRLDLRGGDRGHAAPDPGLRGADRVADPGPDRAAVAAAGPPRRPLPRRGRGTAHAQAVRPGQGPGHGDPRSHRRAPARDHAHAAGGVPVRPGAGAVRRRRDRAGGGGSRAAAAGRAHSVPDRTAGPAAHPGGVPAAARGRPAVPREHGGGHRGRPGLRDPRHPRCPGPRSPPDAGRRLARSRRPTCAATLFSSTERR